MPRPLRIGLACGIVFLATDERALSPRASAQQPQIQKRSADEYKLYSSPREVFDAYRGAVARHDFRSMDHCLTKKRQDLLIHEVYVACCIRGGPRVLYVLKKFGIEESKMSAEYEKVTQGKAGSPEHFMEFVIQRIGDRPGFLVAAYEALEQRDVTPQRLSQLQSVQIKGDLATGRVNRTVTIEMRTRYPPQPEVIRRQLATTDVLFGFRKTEKGWLIDSEKPVSR
jgi:hypothetical protein